MDNIWGFTSNNEISLTKFKNVVAFHDSKGAAITIDFSTTPINVAMRPDLEANDAGEVFFNAVAKCVNLPLPFPGNKNIVDTPLTDEEQVAKIQAAITVLNTALREAGQKGIHVKINEYNTTKDNIVGGCSYAQWQIDHATKLINFIK